MQRAFFALALVLSVVPDAPAQQAGAAPRQRRFEFVYAGKLTDVPAGKSVRVWLPLPQSTGEQDVVTAGTRVPADAVTGRDREYGNRMLSFETRANERGEIPF